MKRFQSILCATFLTLSISSAALAGNISGGAPTKDGNISGGKAGNISGGKAGNISGGKAGDISGLTDEVYLALLALLGAIIP